MAWEEIQLGRFEQWAQNIEDKRLIFFATEIGHWFDNSYQDLDARDQFLIEMMMSAKPATDVFLFSLANKMSEEERARFFEARRQARNEFESGPVGTYHFHNAGRLLITDLIYEMFSLSDRGDSND